MKYISIDIETTGLDETWCQILEIGAVCADTCQNNVPVNELPYFKCRFYYDRVVGEPYALHLNAQLIREMDNRDPIHNYMHPDSFWSRFCNWVDMEVGADYKPSFSGKNYGTFDSLFLRRLPRWNKERFSNRVIDPAILFAHPKQDYKMPDLITCIFRSGVKWDQASHHNALEDARVVVELVRAGFKSMSTEYYLKPPMTYEEVLSNLPHGVTISREDCGKYVGRHCLLSAGGSSIWLFGWEGAAGFEAFSGQDWKILLGFGRDVINEYEEVMHERGEDSKDTR